ncbi:DUF2867 domain-containing protein [Hymenobacter gummosus]|uniref:DUF2867 domain-containing protein n=1 Tax=Hymenobacter gummosus TaxID=1776032 RepID=A0A3S0JFC6_9BACT|nr:DUF2867 domain-containing protein [Hymenobacter gummosus]RTQ47831.1 DUF2867 domain-containing protein [Hymenobacter gummosus]
MPAISVRPVPLPPASQLPQALSRLDFADAYQVPLPATAPVQPLPLAYALLGQAPGWVRSLLRLRDALVRALGLRTFPVRPTHPDPAGLRPGDEFGPFGVLRVLPTEVLLGQDDRHLDFRVSVLRLPDAAVVSTAVRFHNRLGRLYFALIRPFHRLIVPAMLRFGCRRLARPEQAASAPLPGAAVV